MIRIENVNKLKTIVILHFIILLYSLGGICSKTAAGEQFLSLKWILLYGGQIAILGIYAILWQQVLKSLPLNTAYANKSVNIIWGMIWGAVIFGEQITPKMLIGSAVVIAGVVMMIKGGDRKNE